MIRLTLLTLFIAFLVVYAWRDWYKALCGLIFLISVIEHPDMPKTLLGVPGLSPWNILLASVFFAWLKQKKEEGLTWDMPRKFTWLFVLYAMIIVVGYFRMIGDSKGIAIWASFFNEAPYSNISLFSEYFINTFKWVVPGMLLFSGCNSRKRLVWAITAILLMYIFLAIQVIRWMPIGALADGDALEHYGLRFLSNEVGFHRVNLSMMLSGAFWAIVASLALFRPVQRRLFGMSTSLVFLGMALTGGRMGYATWGALAIMLSSVRWRKYLFMAPVLAFVVVMLVPAIQERFTAGFNEDSIDSSGPVEEHYEGDIIAMQLYTITSGRSFAWPFVIEYIEESPWVGYGREGMIRSGISTYLAATYAEAFPHPHNATLQWIMDNGFLGLIPVAMLYFLFLKYSWSLLRDSRNSIYFAVGGMAFSLISALLIASIGSQSFYPREGAVGMWCAIGLMLRVYVEREKINAEYKEPLHHARRRFGGKMGGSEKDQSMSKITHEGFWQ